MRSIVLLLVGLLLFGCTAEDTSKNDTVANQTTPDKTEQDITVTSAELATHDMESDCWVLHNGSVYDITAYVVEHPNYQNVLVPHCGLSNSSFDDAFTGTHGSAKIGTLMEEGELKGELED